MKCSNGWILNHPAHSPDTAHPLRIGEVYINPNPTTGGQSNDHMVSRPQPSECSGEPNLRAQNLTSERENGEPDSYWLISQSRVGLIGQHVTSVSSKFKKMNGFSADSHNSKDSWDLDLFGVSDPEDSMTQFYIINPQKQIVVFVKFIILFELFASLIEVCLFKTLKTLIYRSGNTSFLRPQT